MNRSDEGAMPEHEQAIAQEERDAETGAGAEHDPIRHPEPPGNPETDEEAVEKGEEQIGRVVGR